MGDATGHATTTEIVPTLDAGTHPALVTTRASDSMLLTLVRTRAPDVDDEFLGEHEPYFWQAEISSDRLDSYSTRMARSTLKNYAADANAGVPFMNSHRTGGLFGVAELPLGRSLEGKFNAGQRSGEPTTHATFYTFRGLRLGDVSTDEFIDGVRSGIVRDVSVGFQGGRFFCDICDEDMMRSETCFHFPGHTYEVGEGKTKKQVVCTVRIEDARLGEVSAVYKGSTPGAMITKAQRLAASHALSPQTITLLEDQYRIVLPGSVRTFFGTSTNTANGVVITPPEPAPEEVEEMGDRTENTETAALQALQDQLAQVRSALGLTAGADVLAHVAQQRERLQTAEAEVERLKPMAVDGEAYRNDLIAQVTTEGKRAVGEGWNEEQQTAILQRAPIEALKATRDNYKGVADKLFPAARVTEDDDEDTTPRRPARRRAYAGV